MNDLPPAGMIIVDGIYILTSKLKEKKYLNNNN